ncbi:MAG: JAB domain-containing protein, partial [Planctomycetes bacterium]|nr:JAB domain-containing protein [Planctomycetota bacterium]
MAEMYICEEPVVSYEEHGKIKEALEIMSKKVIGTDPINKPNQIKAYLQLKIGLEPLEVVGIVLLNQSNRIMAVETVEEGIENRAHVYMKKLARKVLATSASAIILFHNHP